MTFARLRSKGVGDTHAVAGTVASIARAGDLILLVGELGVGKTAFVQGFARRLGVTSPVTSPTFTLVHRYEATPVIHHVDVYRLDRLSELADLGLPEMFEEGVTLIEWGDVVSPALPSDFLEIVLSYADDPAVDDAAVDERDIAFSVVGGSWTGRVPALRRALDC
jgi:tRNA threonylcarbamoyladenosine biosynthesis protein TsaE